MPRVLIAEDDSTRAGLIQDFCKGMDYEPLVVEDGQAAVEAARESAPDLVLLDFQAAAVDGLAATIALRGLQNVTEQMMIIGLNSDSADMAAACKVAGMNQILQRPLQPERLLAALRAAKAPLNLQAATQQEHAPDEVPAQSEEALQRLAAQFGPMPAQTPFARLYCTNAHSLAGSYGADWPQICAQIDLITRLVIERHIGESAAYKKAADMDYVLVTPGLARAECEAKCLAITQEICRTLAGDERGARFHIRTVTFEADPAAQAELADPAAQAEAARAANPDILAWTHLRFWPVWDTQRRTFPIRSIRADRDEHCALLPQAREALRGEGRVAYFAALDVSVVADLTARLEGYETLEQPRLLTLPLHLPTLENFAAMSRYQRYLEMIPKKIRERLVIELHGVPKEMRAAQLAEMQKPLLPHCLHTMMVVSPLFRNMSLLKQMSGQMTGVELAEGEVETDQEFAVLKPFGATAKQSGLTMAATLVRDRPFRDWGLTSCRYVFGPAIAAAQDVLAPKAKFIA